MSPEGKMHENRTISGYLAMAISPGKNAQSLCVLTYTWFDRIERGVKTPIDN